MQAFLLVALRLPEAVPAMQGVYAFSQQTPHRRSMGRLDSSKYAAPAATSRAPRTSPKPHTPAQIAQRPRRGGRRSPG